MPGRPRKNAPALRYTNVLQVRLNDEQFAALKLGAAEEEVSLSTYIRGVLHSHLARAYPEFFVVSDHESEVYGGGGS